MRRQQIIQILQFLVAWVCIWAFVSFVLKLSFIDVVVKYWLYFLIVSVSYFYYYSILYETDKKYDFIRNAVIWGNVYLFAHIFFRPLLNISHELFLLLGLIILGLRGTTKMKSRWKGLLQIIGGIFSFFILISGIFYLYPDEPDIDGFKQSRRYELSVLGIDKMVAESDAYLQIKTARRSDQFQIVPNFTKILSENCRVIYPSLKAYRDEKVIISTPSGGVFIIFPQSEIEIEFSGNEMLKISQIRGKFGFLSGMFESSLEIDGNIQNLASEQLEFMQGVYEGYQSDLVRYLKNQVSDSNISLANSTIMYNIDGAIIKFLAKMFPASFSKNLHNYNLFQYYFSLVQNDEINLTRYDMQSSNQSISASSLWKTLRDNMQLGKLSTYDIRKKH